MKIDLYNNTKTFIQESRQNSAISKWTRSHNVSLAYLMEHPQCQDVAFLLEFKTEFQAEYKLNLAHARSMTQYWDNTYCLKKPLKPKAFHRLEEIALACLETRKRINAQRERIKSLRQQQGQPTIKQG
jgi:hypothetical protein